MRPPLETLLYVVVMRDPRNGRPRGFEKVSDDRFHHTPEDAAEQLAAMPAAIRGAYMVAPFLAYFTDNTP